MTYALSLSLSLSLCTAVTRKTRLLDVVYNASNNELVRTKTLVKNCIVHIDATPFRQWSVLYLQLDFRTLPLYRYEQHYGLPIGRKKSQQRKDVSFFSPSTYPPLSSVPGRRRYTQQETLNPRPKKTRWTQVSCKS